VGVFLSFKKNFANINLIISIFKINKLTPI